MRAALRVAPLRVAALRVAAVAAAALLAGCTQLVTTPTRAHDAPFAIPQDLTWQYATSCMAQMTSGENCLSQYRFGPRADSFTFVDAFERAQLWDYYTTVTKPCLAENGVTVPSPDRDLFFLPDQRPWNPYTAMDDLPFDRLIALYQDCPPIREYPSSRHEP